MHNAKALGRMAAKLNENEQKSLKAAKVKAIEDDVRGQKAQLERQGRVFAHQEQEILVENQQRGNFSRQDLKQNLYMGIWRLAFVFLSTPIEFYFAYLTFSYFNWGIAFSIAAAIGFVAISLEIVDQYITWYRKNHPDKGDRLFQILSSLGIVILILVIFLSAEIRQHLHQAVQSIGPSESLEAQIKNAEKFYNQSSGNFNYLMAAFTGAIILSTGICLHEAHNRLLLAIPLLRRYRRLDRVRAEMTETAGRLNQQDQRISEFEAEFEQGLVEGKLKLRKQRKPRTKLRKEALMKSITVFLTHPLTLICLGMFIFFALQGVAHGMEWIINLDISKSVETKDYTGKETEFSKNVEAVEKIIRNQLAPGDKITVVGITKYSFSRPYILLNYELVSIRNRN